MAPADTRNMKVLKKHNHQFQQTKHLWIIRQSTKKISLEQSPFPPLNTSAFGDKESVLDQPYPMSPFHHPANYCLQASAKSVCATYSYKQ